MRVGILTFHRAMNYGAALQAYSLFSFLKQCGHNAEVIDFIPGKHLDNIALLKPPTSVARLKRDVVGLLCTRSFMRRKHDFDSFRETFFGPNQRRGLTFSNLESALKDYDVVICGSDQIWNPRLVDADLGFFAPYGSGFKRVAYGASLGVGMLDEYGQSEVIRTAIDQFDYISFREEASKSKTEEFVHPLPNAPIVVDPTLLMDGETFDRIASPSLISESYIFVYSVPYREQTFAAAETLSKRTGLPVYTLYPGGHPRPAWLSRQRRLPKGDIGPRGFISLIRNAAWCVTDSFHCTVFSSLYERNYFVIDANQTDGVPSQDRRLEEFLGAYDLSNRMVTADKMGDVPLEQSFDVTAFQHARQLNAAQSSNWLRDALDH